MDFAVLLFFKSIVLSIFILITDFVGPLPSLKFVFEIDVSLILHSACGCGCVYFVCVHVCICGE